MKLESRVLGRVGARELTLDETQMVSGAAKTNVCSRTNQTVTGDGDACTDHDQ